MGAPYHNISPVMHTASAAWIKQQTLRGIGVKRARIYVDEEGDFWGQYENNDPKKIAGLKGGGSNSDGAVPVGAVFQWIGSVAPDGYLLCDGSNFSGFPKLKALLTSYGGKTPDLRGRFILGASTTTPSYTNSFPGPLNIMATGGALETVLSLQHMPEHSHEIEAEVTAEHDHAFDVPEHSHTVTTLAATGHSHTFDAGGYVSDAIEEQDVDTADWAPTVTTEMTSVPYADSDGNNDETAWEPSLGGTGTYDTAPTADVTAQYTGSTLDTSSHAAIYLSDGMYVPNLSSFQLWWGSAYGWGDDAYGAVAYLSADWSTSGTASDWVGDAGHDLDWDFYEFTDHAHHHQVPAQEASIENLDHTHAVDAAEAIHTHDVEASLDEAQSSHFHSIDYDLPASTNDTNNGISWVAEMAASGMTSDDGFIDDASDTDFINGDAGGHSGATDPASGAMHSHGGRTFNTGLSDPDPVQSLPPYIAMNYIIKHD
jgi:microcystin-dependent protein